MPEPTVWMIQCALNIVDCCIRHPATFKYFKPLLRRLLFRFLLYHVVEFHSMFNPSTVSHKARICLPFRMSESVAQDAEQPIISTSEEDIAIMRLVTSVWNDGS